MTSYVHINSRFHIQVFAHGFNMWDGLYYQYCKLVHGNQPQHSTTLHNNKWLSTGIENYLALSTINHYEPL